MTPAEVLHIFHRLEAQVNCAQDPVSACWASDARYAFADAKGLSDGEGEIDYAAVEVLYAEVYGEEWAS